MTFGLRAGRDAGGELTLLTDELGEVLNGVTLLVFGAVLLGPRSTSSPGESACTRSRA